MFPVLSDMRTVCTRGDASIARSRIAVRSADPPSLGTGLGPLLEAAMVLRSAVSMSIAFFGVRRSSELEAFRDFRRVYRRVRRRRKNQCAAPKRPVWRGPNGPHGGASAVEGCVPGSFSVWPALDERLALVSLGPSVAYYRFRAPHAAVRRVSPCPFSFGAGGVRFVRGAGEGFRWSRSLSA